MALLLHFLVLVSLLCPVFSSKTIGHHIVNQTFQSKNEFYKLKKELTVRLQRINKPAVKTIASRDGDIIDCVLTHKQPAFDHPLLKGQKPLDPPTRPRGHNQTSILNDNFQLWSLSRKSCPKGTIPIRRTKKEDILRTNSIHKFGRKLNQVKTIDLPTDHVHATAFVNGEYHGGKATLNVWAPHLESDTEFSLAQIWAIAGTFGTDLNTIEVGWQVYHAMYGDNLPRLFIYWTADSYQRTGRYNLLCSGFVQTNNKIALGGAISPTSTYNGPQFEITLLIFKDANGNWWLKYGSETIVGYWPASLFPLLKDKATSVSFGGEIVNSKSKGSHTSTQMGSGHFAEEGFGKASYFVHLEVEDVENKLIPFSDPMIGAEEPNCYNIQVGNNDRFGSHFFYGGPGRNVNCPPKGAHSTVLKL